MELETQIYNSETNYIVETANTGGNILQGFENYLKAGTSSRKRVEILETDRIFSHSSSSAQRVCRGGSGVVKVDTFPLHLESEQIRGRISD